jgi:hypothetical protein
VTYESDGKAVPFEMWVRRGVRRQSLMKWMGLVQKTKKLFVNCDHPNGEVVQLSVLNSGPIVQTNNKRLYSELLVRKTGKFVHIPRIQTL